MRSIRFIRGAAPYNAGEVACFDDAEAERHVAHRLAVFVNPPGSPSTAPVVTRENPVATNPAAPVVPRAVAPQAQGNKHGNKHNH